VKKKLRDPAFAYCCNQNSCHIVKESGNLSKGPLTISVLPIMKTFALIAVVTALVVNSAIAQRSDVALRRVTGDDVSLRDPNGKLKTLSAADHLTRAEVYSSNRLFPQAREHWQIVLDNYPQDPGIPKALFGTARSYMWEREYAKAVEWFDKLARDYPNTKEGREGLAFKGASYVRMGKNLEAAKVYEQYTVMFPEGERIESAYLNLIDAYREAGQFDDARKWAERTVTRFAGKPATTNALQALVRMEFARADWNAATAAADRLLSVGGFAGSMTNPDEARYLKALALQRAGKRSDAMSIYRTISGGYNSYYGGLASEQLLSSGQVTLTASNAPRLYSDYPVMFTADLLKHAKARDIDPRFLLAIMKQESSFRPNAKSPAAARGLLQLVFDTAIRYKNSAGYPKLRPDDLYSPSVNIAVGAAYIADLKTEFGGLYEAIAASYNGGEDNVARWLNRTDPKDPGLFAAEIGFAETKNYVFKVMNNYRVYRELYNERLERK
jgi:soluble lytic murein transglycosylase